MESNCTKPQHATALSVFLPSLSAISGAANADPGTTQQTAVGSESFATSKTGAEQRTWQWKSDPEACRRGDLNDYTEEFALDERQTIDRVVAGKAGPLRAATSQ